MKKNTTICELVVSIGDGIRHSFFNQNSHQFEQSDGTVINIQSDGTLKVKALNFALVRDVRLEDVVLVHSEATVRQWKFL